MKEVVIDLPRALVVEALDNAGFDEDCLTEYHDSQVKFTFAVLLPGVPEFARFMLEIGLLCDGMGEDIIEHALRMADTTQTRADEGGDTMYYWPLLVLTHDSFTEVGPVR